VFSDGSLNTPSCNYLFIDSADGVTINVNGLFPRKTVFTGLGIKQTTYYVNTGSPSLGGPLSFAYKRAMVAGQTLTKLIERKGREAVQQAIIERAHEDAVFARDVVARPRETLEKFLGVKIAETISLSVVAEDAGKFMIVIPQKSSGR